MRNGSFSERADRKVFNERILLNGYQSKISRIMGRLTAIGLLSKAKMKNPKVKK
jgi:hypothetical protein